jgi:tripeptidyl-peptidase-2
LFQVLPEIKLKSLVQNYRPLESKIVPLGERDVVPVNRKIYELQNIYAFSASKAAEITPNFPWLSGVLYESEFESQMWMLYNSHKQLVTCGDAYPSKYSVKVREVILFFYIWLEI